MEIYLKGLKDYFKKKSIYNHEIYKNKDISDKSLQPNKHFYEDASKYVYSEDMKNGSSKLTLHKPVYKDINKELQVLNQQQMVLLEILNTHNLTPEEYEANMNQYQQNKTEIEKLHALIKKPSENKDNIVSNINNIEIELYNLYQQLKLLDKNDNPTDWKQVSDKYFSLKQKKSELISVLNSDYGIEEIPETKELYTAGKKHPHFYIKKYTDNTVFNMVIEKEPYINIDTSQSSPIADAAMDAAMDAAKDADKDTDTHSKKKSKKKNDCNQDYKCPEDKICNTDTGNCVSKKGAVGKKILLANATSKSSDTNETKATKKPKAKAKAKENKNCNDGFICPEDKICNPDTGKCVSKKGVVGKKILAGTTDKKESNTNTNASKKKDCNEDFICPEDKICNPPTGKCVKKDGKIGKELVSNQQKGGKTVLLKM